MNNEQPQMNIDFSQTTAEVCEECGNDTFSQVSNSDGAESSEKMLFEM